MTFLVTLSGGAREELEPCFIVFKNSALSYPNQKFEEWRSRCRVSLQPERLDGFQVVCLVARRDANFQSTVSWVDGTAVCGQLQCPQGDPYGLRVVEKNPNRAWLFSRIPDLPPWTSRFVLHSSHPRIMEETMGRGGHAHDREQDVGGSS